MKISNNWLVLEDRDIVKLSLDIDIQSVEKHFVDFRNRSFLHSGVNCEMCARGLPKRIRYVARCIYDGQSLKWEFGEDVYRKIKLYISDDPFVNLSVTRLGTGAGTDYKIEEARSLDRFVNTESAREIWQSVLKQLGSQVSKSNYQTWLKDTEGMSFDNNNFVVGTPNDFVAEWLNSRLLLITENELFKQTGRLVKVQFLSIAPEIHF